MKKYTIERREIYEVYANNENEALASIKQKDEPKDKYVLLVKVEEVDTTPQLPWW